MPRQRPASANPGALPGGRVTGRTTKQKSLINSGRRGWRRRRGRSEQGFGGLTCPHSPAATGGGGQRVRRRGPPPGEERCPRGPGAPAPPLPPPLPSPTGLRRGPPPAPPGAGEPEAEGGRRAQQVVGPPPAAGSRARARRLLRGEGLPGPGGRGRGAADPLRRAPSARGTELPAGGGVGGVGAPRSGPPLSAGLGSRDARRRDPIPGSLRVRVLGTPGTVGSVPVTRPSQGSPPPPARLRVSEPESFLECFSPAVFSKTSEGGESLASRVTRGLPGLVSFSSAPLWRAQDLCIFSPPK